MMLALIQDRLIAKCQPPFVAIKDGVGKDAIKNSPQSPTGFVIPLSEVTTKAVRMTGPHRHEITQIFGVLIILRLYSDPRGSRKIAPLQALRQSLKDALLNWVPSPDHTAILFEAGGLDRIEEGEVRWLDSFSTRTVF